ncbi:MAG: outer membrane beta-barrel protein [Candidatus Kapabacteria bacterium]|nr:outer membrane beta-barrel protein [Candidatus Kapabacteria bacterium]
MLKVFATVVALFVCSMSLSAQSYIFDKGVVTLGGSIGFNSTSGGNTTFSVFNLSPNAGYFFSKNLEVGLGLNFVNTSTSTEVAGQTVSSSGSTTTIGPYVRYFFTEGRPVLSPFVGANLNLRSGGGNSSTSFGGEVGLAYVLARNVAALGALGFTKIDGGTVIGLNVGVGVYIW